jgi:plastocyanin
MKSQRRHHTRNLSLVSLTLLAFVLAVLAVSAQAAGRTVVAISCQGPDGMQFSPDPITIHVGETVVWTNPSTEVHNVVDDPTQVNNKSEVQLPRGARPFNSGYIKPGQSYAHTFTVPGVYRYACNLHEDQGMFGKIIVLK